MTALSKWSIARNEGLIAIFLRYRGTPRADRTAFGLLVVSSRLTCQYITYGLACGLVMD